MSSKFKCGNSIIALVTVFVVGYGLIIFSMMFGKSTEYSAIIETELSETNYELEFCEKQLTEKRSEIVSLTAKMNNVAPQIGISQLNNPNDVIFRSGVIILGMHRSGTSVLGGLVNKMGLRTGGPLIAPAEDNEKGFFERIDVVLQNDALMHRQNVDYAYNTYKYDATAGVKDILNDDGSSKFFSEGKRGLQFLNDPKNYPWMLKDPRLCITVRTWLPVLKVIPAILFSYRHPFDVAMSMKKRETEHFKISKGLKMWYVYNRRAIQQTHDLCRVTTSHRAVMQQPQVEFDRIYVELRQCGVPVPHKLAPTDISSFIDSSLQHGKSTLKDTSCAGDLSTLSPPEAWPTSEAEHVSLYREVMRVYCGLEDGSALRASFQWDESIRDN
jgi:hypothetical protein